MPIKKNLASLMTSNKQDWKTPKHLLVSLTEEFGKLYDPCPTNYIIDGLSISWISPAFVNPEYNRKTLRKWVRKCVDEALKGVTVLLLIPSRTDTKIFHQLILPYADEIRFLTPRLKFSDQKNSSTFGSILVIFGGKDYKKIEDLELGKHSRVFTGLTIGVKY